MRTPGLGDSRVSSTSGVLPTSSRSEVATALRTPLPHVDGRAELPEQLVDPPQQPTFGRRERSRAVLRDQRVAVAVEPGDLEEVVGRAPRAVFDHPLAPLRPEPFDGAELETGVLRSRLEAFAV